VGAGKDFTYGAYKSINGVLSGPAKHALQAICWHLHYKILRLLSLLFTFLHFSAALLVP